MRPEAVMLIADMVLSDSFMQWFVSALCVYVLAISGWCVRMQISAKESSARIDSQAARIDSLQTDLREKHMEQERLIEVLTEVRRDLAVTVEKLSSMQKSMDRMEKVGKA